MQSCRVWDFQGTLKKKCIAIGASSGLRGQAPCFPKQRCAASMFPQKSQHTYKIMIDQSIDLAHMYGRIATSTCTLHSCTSRKDESQSLHAPDIVSIIPHSEAIPSHPTIPHVWWDKRAGRAEPSHCAVEGHIA